MQIHQFLAFLAAGSCSVALAYPSQRHGLQIIEHGQDSTLMKEVSLLKRQVDGATSPSPAKATAKPKNSAAAKGSDKTGATTAVPSNVPTKEGKGQRQKHREEHPKKGKGGESGAAGSAASAAPTPTAPVSGSSSAGGSRQ